MCKVSKFAKKKQLSWQSLTPQASAWPNFTWLWLDSSHCNFVRAVNDSTKLRVERSKLAACQLKNADSISAWYIIEIENPALTKQNSMNSIGTIWFFWPSWTSGVFRWESLGWGPWWATVWSRGGASWSSPGPSPGLWATWPTGDSSGEAAKDLSLHIVPIKSAHSEEKTEIILVKYL